MLNEEKVKAMSRLAIYENGVGKKHLQISKYFRTDYVGQALIRTFFLVTIGYFLILALLAAYFSEYLMNNIHKMDLRVLAISLIVGYVVLLVVYILVTIIVYNVRYFRAKKHVKKYYEQLTKLEKMYQKEERKGGKKR